MGTLSSASARSGSILIVEDRDDVREGLAQLLEFSGYLVEEARDGEAALRILDEEHRGIALIVLDLILPGEVSGSDLRTRMLVDPRCADIPAIIVTASEIDAPGRAGLCPSAWLDKPFRFDQLLDLVRRFVLPDLPSAANFD